MNPVPMSNDLIEKELPSLGVQYHLTEREDSRITHRLAKHANLGYGRTPF
jgi:hypothetical protein